MQRHRASASPAVRTLLLAASLFPLACRAGGASTPEAETAADLIVLDARVTTQDPGQPDAQAFAVRDGIFVAVGSEEEVAALRGKATLVIDAEGRRVIPGLVDSHLHAVRGGRFYNLELRWEGVDSL